MASTHSAQLVRPDGARIAYRLYGTGTHRVPLVLVNGMSSVMPDWAELVPALAKTRRVLVFDHRGIGESSLPPDSDDTLSIEMMADDVLALVEHLGFRTVHLLGYSMGGLIVQAVLTHEDARPTKDGRGVSVRGVEVRRAILTSTFAKSPSTEFRARNIPRGEGLPKAERDRLVVEYFTKLQYHDDVLVPGHDVQKKFDSRMVLAAQTRRPQLVILQQSMAISQCDVREKLKELPRGLPIMVIHGRRDRMVRYVESEELLEHIPQAVRYVPRPAGSPDGTEEFGHFWYDYFDVERDWVAPITRFLDAGEAHL